MWNRQIIKQILLKGYHDLRFRAVVTGMFAFVWWGILYPDLCFTDSTYTQVIVEEGQEIEVGQPDYQDLLQAEGDVIVIRSRLLEWIGQKISKKQTGKR